MNKFDKKIIDSFIRFNKINEFIRKYKNDRQAILYYVKYACSEEHVNELTNVVISFEDAEFLTDFALGLNKNLNSSVYKPIISNLKQAGISKKNKNIKYLCRIIRHVNNLTEEQKTDIFDEIANSDEYFEIYRLAKETKLDNKRKNTLTNRICSSNNSNLIEKYIKDIKDLQSDDIDLLVDKIIKLGKINYFELLSLRNLSDKNKEDLIDAALATNDANYIFSYSENSHYADYKNKKTFEKIIDKFIKLNAIRELVEFYISYCIIMPTEAINLSSKVVNALVKCDETKPELSKWICCLLKNVHFSNSLLALLKNKLLQLKEPKYIAEYIILKNDKQLLKEIFGDTLSFCLFCMSNKLCDDMNKLINLFGADVESEEYQNYVDDNIESYNKNVASLK